MRIRVTSVFVDDQDKALKFYTDVLGFLKKTEIPLGGGARWLTVVSPDDPDGIELLLEPAGHPAVGPYRDSLVSDGIPMTSFTVDDVRAETERLRELGVVFTQEPLQQGPVTTAVFDDTLRKSDPDRRAIDQPGRRPLEATSCRPSYIDGPCSFSSSPTSSPVPAYGSSILRR